MTETRYGVWLEGGVRWVGTLTWDDETGLRGDDVCPESEAADLPAWVASVEPGFYDANGARL